jgi:hypothetical protein
MFTRGLKAVLPSSSSMHARFPGQDLSEEEGLLMRSPTEPEESYELESKAGRPKQAVRVLPFRRIWTKNVMCTLLAQAFFDFQMG